MGRFPTRRWSSSDKGHLCPLCGFCLPARPRTRSREARAVRQRPARERRNEGGFWGALWVPPREPQTDRCRGWG